MSVAAPRSCPNCSGALLVARDRMDKAKARATELRQDAIAIRRDIAIERRRARNGDPWHKHGRGRSRSGDCTLTSHGEEADRLQGEAAKLEDMAYEQWAIALTAAGTMRDAALRILRGCDLCGRPAAAVKGRAA